MFYVYNVASTNTCSTSANSCVAFLSIKATCSARVGSAIENGVHAEIISHIRCSAYAYDLFQPNAGSSYQNDILMCVCVCMCVNVRVCVCVCE